jgi:hypothetical protein
MSGAHYFSQEWRPWDLRDCDLRRDLEADDDTLRLLMEDRWAEARELHFELEREIDAQEEADRADDLQRDREDS